MQDLRDDLAGLARRADTGELEMTDEIEYASVEDLLAGDPLGDNTRDVTLSTGKTITVRGMSRMELLLSRKGTEDPGEIERRMLSYCMVKPRMTAQQVTAWQKATLPMVMAPVTEAIRNLSGLGEGADKSDLPPDGDEP
jgi:hypothetical protein